MESGQFDDRRRVYCWGLWYVKSKGDALKDVRFEVDTTQELLTMDFVGQDKRFVFEPLRVVMRRRDGTLIDARDDRERSFDDHQLETPWDDIHLAYFSGEALWTYLNTPLLFTWTGFVTEEIAPIEVDAETWRRLKVTFPDHIKSHTCQQIACFGPDGLLRSHDFTIDILGGATGLLYATDYRDVDGIIIPTTPTGLRLARATTSSSRSRCCTSRRPAMSRRWPRAAPPRAARSRTQPAEPGPYCALLRVIAR